MSKTALITGASQGIGRTVAKGLAADGFEVALLARNQEALTTLSEEIQAGGGSSIVLPCDVTDEAQVERTVATLREQWKSLDLLFNNAGAFLPGTVELSSEDFQKIYDVNVTGVFHVLHYTVPWFTEQKSGTIVNLSSIAGVEGFPTVGAYCSSKWALRGLNESLSRELEPLGIRVTAISPSWVDTEMSAHAPMENEEKIPAEEITKTIRYIMALGPTATVREIIVRCRADLL